MKWGYTLEIYRKDRRVKGGEKLVVKKDYENYSGNAMMDEILYLSSTEYPADKYRLTFHQTYVPRVNKISGDTYWERYDTPLNCSPSSETYWSS